MKTDERDKKQNMAQKQFRISQRSNQEAKVNAQHDATTTVLRSKDRIQGIPTYPSNL